MPPVPPDKGVRQNWYDWRQNPRSLPAVALVAAAKLAGLPIDSLLSASPASPDRQASRLESLERQVADLTRRLEQREQQDHVASTTEPTPVSVDTSERMVVELEEKLYSVGRQLGRPWDDSVEYDASAGRAEFLRHRIGTLEARLVTLAGMVGATAGGYPSAPESADIEDEEFRMWLADVVAILQRQLPSVLESAETLLRTREGERRASEEG
jgi:hypothetical protein